MPLERVAPTARRMLQWSVIALGASLPVSTALDNILLGVALIAWACSAQWSATYKIFNKNNYLRLILLLLGALALGMSYGESRWREAFSTFSKYADLIWIPIFIVACREPATRLRAVHAFAISIALVVILSYLIRFGWLPALPFITGNPDSPTVFKFKITHNFLVGFGAFLFVWLAHSSANPRVRLTWYALALLAALNVLLLVQGATGYLTLGALILLLGWEHRGERGVLYATIALTALAAALVIVPSSFRERVALIHQEVQQWRIDDASQTSSGLRLEYYHHTLELIKGHPLTGVGTGGFARAYAKQVEGTGKLLTQNPHNEFLHIAAQIGIAGLILLLALFWKQWRDASQLATPMEQSLARALVLAMIVGCMVNSLLLDHVEGLFYAWLTGVLYGGLKYTSHENIASRP